MNQTGGIISTHTSEPDSEDEVLDGVSEVELRSHTVSADQHGERIDRALAQAAGEFSRSYLQQLIEGGAVTLNGHAVGKPAQRVKAGDVVVVELRPTQQSQAFKAQPMDLEVVYEDAHVLVINKPAGLVVHPAPGNWSGTLLNGLLARDPQFASVPRAGIVHRLDKDTSGLMVVGKSLQACTALTRAIAAREVHRRYRALVWGHPPEAVRIDAPVGRDPVSRVKMAVVHSGKPAMTDVRTLATVDWISETGGADRTISAVECTLHTGRTHQIRVHMASRRWPLVADALYGGAPALGLQRQALHAVRLELAHPLNGEPLTFEASLPPDMAQAWAQVVHNGPAGV